MMKEELKVERAVKNQIPQIVELVRSSLDETYLIPSIYRGNSIEKYLENEFNNPKSPYYYFVVIFKNEIVGYCELKSFYPAIFLNMITVDNSYKDRGVGSFMLGYLTSFFKSNDYGAILLDVFKSNEIADEWYKKKSFKTESAKYLSKFTGDCFDDNIPFQILNYPQIQLEKENYGFSIVKVKNNNEIYEYGVINKTLISRSEYSNMTVKLGFELLHYLQMEDLYVFSTTELTENNSSFETIDCIYRKRMKL